MDSSDDSSMTVMGMMTPWLHFSGGDNLFFKSLTPNSKGAIAGAAIVLFFISVFERFLAAKRVTLELKWRERARTVVAGRVASAKGKKSEYHGESSERSSLVSASRVRTIAPFIPSQDFARGAFHALQALVRFTIMLAIMTFQAAYIITLIVGLSIGEMFFGRQIALDIHGQSHIH